MPRPRTPLAVAKANGAVDAKPSRYKGRREPESRPLGKPSPTLNKREVQAWEAFKREAHWLMECDRSLVELACQCRARVWARTASDKDIDRLMRALTRLGMTPVDRQRVLIAEKPGSETFADKYLN